MKINSQNWKGLVKDFPELSQILREEKVNWAKNPVKLTIQRASWNNLLIDCENNIGTPCIYIGGTDIGYSLVADVLQDEGYFILYQVFNYTNKEITIFKVSASVLAEAKEKLAQERANYQQYLKFCFNREAEKVLIEFLKTPDLHNLADVRVFWSKEELWFDSSLLTLMDKNYVYEWPKSADDWAESLIAQAYRRYEWIDDII